MEKLFKDFMDIIADGKDLKKDFIDELYRSVEIAWYRKGEYWLGRGRRNADVVYIHDGSAMSFRYSNGSSHVTNLWNSGDIILEGSTLFPKRTQDVRVVFLENSEVLILSVSSIEKLQGEYADARFIVNRMLVRSLERLEELYFLMKCLSPKERLANTLKKYARPFHLLTSSQKASYLGVAKQTLYNISASQ